MKIGFVWQSRGGSVVHSVKCDDGTTFDVRHLAGKRAMCGRLPKDGWQNAHPEEPDYLHVCWTCFDKRTLMLAD